MGSGCLKEFQFHLKSVKVVFLIIFTLFILLSLLQEYMEDQKYRDEEDLAEKLEGLKSKKM